MYALVNRMTEDLHESLSWYFFCNTVKFSLQTHVKAIEVRLHTKKVHRIVSLLSYIEVIKAISIKIYDKWSIHMDARNWKMNPTNLVLTQ